MRSNTITFNDLLDETITIDGIELEATIRCIVMKIDSKNYSIEFFDMGDIYMRNEVHGLIKLDLTKNHLLKRRFENACEMLALSKAANADESQFDEKVEYA